MIYILKNGRVIDPSQSLDVFGHLLIKDGKIEAILPKSAPLPLADEIIDVEGAVIAPGLIDMHVHFRQPGYEYKETIESGSRAALKGGVTRVACMANTFPVNDNATVTEAIVREAKQVGLIHVHPIGAATRHMSGQELSEMWNLKQAGCVAVSDDGHVIQDAAVARKVMEYASTFHLPVISHAVDHHLAKCGAMSEGLVSTELGLEGIPHAAEDIMIHRDIELSRLTGAHVHIAHVSTREGIRAIRRAKADGVNVTCEVTPHHFTLTDEAVRGYNANAKMMPPLRTEDDILELVAGLVDGTVDAIASDHAPHAADEKAVSFCGAPNGIVGLETILPLSLLLVKKGLLDLKTMIARLTCGPARVLGLDAGTLKVGVCADIVAFYPEKERVFNPLALASKSHNTPFANWSLPGEVVLTIVAGIPRFKLITT